MDDVYVAVSSGPDGPAPRNGDVVIPAPLTELSPNSNVVRDKLIKASWICALFMSLEFVAGWWSNSLALMTDASHLLSDLSAFVIALVSIWVADFPGTNQMSFGFHRAEILGALVSVLLIWVLTVALIVEAFRRVQAPPLVNGRLMFFTAVCGTLANLVMTRILGVHSHGIGGVHSHEEGEPWHGHDHHDHHEHSESQERPESRSTWHVERVSTDDSSHHHQGRSDQEDEVDTEPTAHYYDDETKNVNLRAAYIHALGDLIQNVGVLAASALIWWKPQWSVVDPLCTFFFSILVMATTFSILRDGMHVLMEGSPADLDVAKLRDQLLDLAHVVEVHDLHVWCLSVGKPSLACHLVVDDMHAARAVLRRATLLCQRKFKILHTTIQIDFSVNKVSCGTGAHSRCR